MGTQPVIDGVFDDWQFNAGVLLDSSTASTVRPTSVPPPSPADASVQVWASWDESFLYLAARAWDDALVVDSPEPWNDDELEFGIDGAMDGVFDPEDRQITITIDGYVTDRGVTQLPDVQRAVEIVAGGYQVELAIPVSILQPPGWSAGGAVGFNIGLHDDDDGGAWDHYLIWEGTATNAQAQLFGRLYLEPGCHVADVHPNSDHSNVAACDGDVDIADVQRVAGCWQQTVSTTCPIELNLNGSGAIDVSDIVLAAGYWGWRR